MNYPFHSADGATTWTRFLAFDRWYHCNRHHGTYAVICTVPHDAMEFFGLSIYDYQHKRAVVDDFGNLVRVGDLHD